MRFVVASVNVACLALAIQLLAAEKGSKSVDEPVVIEFDDLDFGVNCKDFHPSKIPDRIRNLSGKRIRIRGYMVPPFEDTGIKRFAFEGETRAKPFRPSSGKPMPVHFLDMVVQLRAGDATEFVTGPLLVEGRFRIKEDIHERELLGLFHIDDATVKAVPPRPGFGRVFFWICELMPHVRSFVGIG